MFPITRISLESSQVRNRFSLYLLLISLSLSQRGHIKQLSMHLLMTLYHNINQHWWQQYIHLFTFSVKSNTPVDQPILLQSEYDLSKEKCKKKKTEKKKNVMRRKAFQVLRTEGRSFEGFSS